MIFSYLPPVIIADNDGDGANGTNKITHIIMYGRNPHSDAGVLAQEWWEWDRLALLLAVLLIVGTGGGYLLAGWTGAYIGFLAGLLLRAGAKLKPVVRWLNTRSHAVEVEASLLVYGGDREALLAREGRSLTYGYGGLYASEAEAVAAMRPHLTAGRRWAEKRLNKLRRFRDSTLGRMGR